MLPIKTILHATDFSPAADHAYRLACGLARDYGARLILMHVRVNPPAVSEEDGMTSPSGSVHGDMLEPEGDLEKLREKLSQMKPPDEHSPVEYVLVDGAPASQIVKAANDRHCDLILMGTHGRAGLGRLLMGSVAEQVVRTAPCPVLTVKTSSSAVPA
jgi:nucleotide-binding universal stress UspA family protein